MKNRGLLWIVGIVAVLGIALSVLRSPFQPARSTQGTSDGSQSTAPEPSKSQTPAQAVQSSAEILPGEKVAHVFADEAGMRAFTQVWKERQQVLLHLRVLQEYRRETQAVIEQLRGQLTGTYGIDLAQPFYHLDREAHVLREQRPSPATQRDGESAQAQDAAQVSPESKKGRIIHTFSSDREIEQFDNLWGEHQDRVLRMMVLEEYWKQEQNTISQFNDKLAATYHLDVTKNYTLDATRRLILEISQQTGPSTALSPAPASENAEPSGVSSSKPVASSATGTIPLGSASGEERGVLRD